MANAAITVDLNARIAQFESELKRANASLDGFARKGSASLGVLKSGIGLLGGTAGVAMFAGFVKSSIDAQDAISKLSQKTGIAVESLAGLQHAADLSDVEVDQLAKGVRTFSVAVAEAADGSKSYQDKLAALGVDFKAIKDLSPEEQFYALADAVSKLGEQDRAAAVSRALGDRMSVLVPLLSGGADGLRQMTDEGRKLNPVTAESARRAEEFNDNLTRIKAAAGSVGVELASALLPSLAATSTKMAEAAASGDLLKVALLGVAGVGKIPWDLILGDIQPAETATERIRELKMELGDLERQNARGDGKLLQMIFGTPDEINSQINVIKNQIEALEKFGDKVYRPMAGAAGAAASGTGTTSPTTKPRTGSKTDPLAGLLGSTDIGRTQEYNRLLGLLDARFAGGKKNAELYAQAVEKLNEQFGRSQIDVFDSGSFQTASKDVAAFIREQQDAINGLNSEMAQDGVRAAQEYESALAALIADTTVIKTQDLHANIAILDQALMDGAISADIHAEALAKLTEGVPEKVEDATNAFRDFGMIMVSSLEEAIVSGAELGDVLKGLEQDLLRMGTRKLVTDPLSKWIDNFDLGSLSLPGSDQNLLGSFASLFGFDGGGYTGDGARTGGLDGKGGFLAVMHPRETVVDHTKGQSLGTTVVMNISTPDANSFRASQGQITAQYAAALQRARRNM